MIVSTKGRYALHVMLALSKHYGAGEYVSLRTIASEQAIPYKYAENICAMLVKAGFIEGTRGKTGGYRLNRTPEEYTALEILQITETGFSAVACTGKEAPPCPKAQTCATLPLWRALDSAVSGVLSSYTLKELSK